MKSAQANSVQGTVTIHEDVIAEIIRKAVAKVKGVARFSGNTILDNIAEIVGTKNRSITVLMEDSAVSADVSLILEFGVSLPDVAAEAQRVIAEDITAFTGLHVDRINILVREIEEPTPQQENDL